MSIILATLAAALAHQLALGEEGCDSTIIHDDDGYLLVYWYEWVRKHIDDDAEQEPVPA